MAAWREIFTRARSGTLFCGNGRYFSASTGIFNFKLTCAEADSLKQLLSETLLIATSAPSAQSWWWKVMVVECS